VSTALAIAGVTATLRAILENAFLRHGLSGSLGADIATSAGPPDRLRDEPPSKATLNVFLRQVSPNPAYRNNGLPAWDASGRNRLSNPPLALNLHYLLSAHSAEEYLPEVVLGHAMHALHEHPLLTRQDISDALSAPAPTDPVAVELSKSRLEEQVESLRISPEFLSTEEMSKFWSATLVHYRPCMAYVVSLVLIQATEPARSPLPVLERRLRVHPELHVVPALTEVVPAENEPVALFETTVKLVGHRLGGSAQKVVLVNDRFEIEHELDATPVGATRLDFDVPVTDAAALPAGVYRVFARVTDSEGSRDTNRLGLTLAPKLTNIAQPVVGSDGVVRVEVEFLPALRAGQAVSLFVGQHECAPVPFVVDPADPPTKLAFSVEGVPPDVHLVRLRVDGIDSPIVDRSEPPKFRDLRVDIA